MKHKRIAIFAAAFVVLVVLVWWATRPDPVEVVVATVEAGLVEETVANTRAGTVDACRRAGLAPQIGGQIDRLPVREGDRVAAGEILLELWNEDLEADLRLANRELEAAQDRKVEACARAEVARKRAERTTRLRESEAASDDEFDLAVGEAEATAAACEAVQAGVEVAEARVSVASATLERTVLRAPFEGTVAEINGELGEFLTPSPVGIPPPPAVDLIDNSCLFIKAPLDEVGAPSIRTGMPARLSLDEFPDRTFQATVRRVAPYVLDVEKQARTVEVEAEIDEPGELTNLLPGYSADLEVILATRESVLRVPTQSILDGDRVLVLADRTIEERPVETGVSNWEYTEVVSGLQEGEVVVVSVDRDGVEPGARARPEPE
jgi:HlyD family secretion protein